MQKPILSDVLELAVSFVFPHPEQKTLTRDTDLSSSSPTDGHLAKKMRPLTEDEMKTFFTKLSQL